jgi:hypothetical protein
VYLGIIAEIWGALFCSGYSFRRWLSVANSLTGRSYFLPYRPNLSLWKVNLLLALNRTLLTRKQTHVSVPKDLAVIGPPFV